MLDRSILPQILPPAPLKSSPTYVFGVVSQDTSQTHIRPNQLLQVTQQHLSQPEWKARTPSLAPTTSSSALTGLGTLHAHLEMAATTSMHAHSVETPPTVPKLARPGPDPHSVFSPVNPIKAELLLCTFHLFIYGPWRVNTQLGTTPNHIPL